VAGLFQAPTLWVEFSEPVSRAAAEVGRYSVEPAIPVQSARLAADARSVEITLASPPEPGRPYQLKVSGVTDASPAANAMKDASLPFSVAKPVYSLAEVKSDQMGTSIRDVSGLPVKGHDAWTLNMFVRAQ